MEHLLLAHRERTVWSGVSGIMVGHLGVGSVETRGTRGWRGRILLSVDSMSGDRSPQDWGKGPDSGTRRHSVHHSLLQSELTGSGLDPLLRLEAEALVDMILSRVNAAQLLDLS